MFIFEIQVTVVLCGGGHTTLTAEQALTGQSLLSIQDHVSLTRLSSHWLAGPGGWWWLFDCRYYQCDMCLPVLRYLHFSAHMITSPVPSIVRKDKAAGWPDISQYSDSDIGAIVRSVTECHSQLAEICLLLLREIIGNIRWWWDPRLGN